MRPVFLQSAAKDKPAAKPWRFWSAFSAAVLAISWGVVSLAGSQNLEQPDPMHDQYSQAVRAEYAQCRKEKSPLSQYFCTCRVLEKQCEAPRRLEHGDWYTVEFWPSNDEDEREVQFILMMDYDILGDFAPFDNGIVLTCMAGGSDLNVFMGRDVDPDVEPVVTIGETDFNGSFIREDDAYILEFENNDKVFSVMTGGTKMTISYRDIEEKEREIEFDTFGFDNVSRGWEKLCSSPTS